MGRTDAPPETSPEATRRFTKALLEDLRALEQVLSRGMIEEGVRRIGAEQELVFVNQGWRPAPVGVEVLERLGDPRFTTELARFNLEANLTPVELRGSCFREFETELRSVINAARDGALAAGAKVVLTGILPSLSKSDLSLDNITPRARYHALNEATTRMRGGAPYRLRLEGADSINLEHDSVMLEAGNTSFQVHLQVGAEEFARCYNVAQVIAAPVLASAVNSPLLFGRRLWSETRIALFQQSIDTRRATPHVRDLSPRVRFGDHWVGESVLELFQEDVARFPVLIAMPVAGDALATVRAGHVPTLDALRLHNSTVYSWNRPCYGVNEGVPHLRIECRYLPSGPSIVDELANAALWVGSMLGAVAELGDVRERIDFAEAKANFVAAARYGLKTGFTWLDGSTVGARDLILESLIPLARAGLRDAGVDVDDVDRLLHVVESRVETGRTGAQWMIESYQDMQGGGAASERLAALTAALVHRQAEEHPVHEWEPARLDEAGGWEALYHRVEQFMATDLFTVSADELVDRVAFLMDRKQLRHVLIEDHEQHLVGIVSYRSLIRLLANGGPSADAVPAVRDIMFPEPITVTPETSSIEAIELMRRNRVSALPVLKAGKLVGLVTEQSFMDVAHSLLVDRLRR